MLDPKVSELARRMIEVQFDERRAELLREVELFVMQMGQQGILSSTIALDRIQEVCAREVKNLVQTVWHSLWRVLSTIGVYPSEALAQDLKAEMEAQVSAYLPKLNDILDRKFKHVYSSDTPTFKDLRDRALEVLREASSQAMKKVRAEIDLFVQSALRRADEQAADSSRPSFPTPVIQQFYSPVGAVLTGPYATAHVVQTLGREDRDALLRALDLVKQSLGALEDLAAVPKADLLELVEEGQTEVKKPRPNGLMLASILNTLATTIQTTASRQPAYQTLKAVLVSLGISPP